MYLVHFFDQTNYEFVMSLHTTRAEAEAAFESMLRRFVIKEGEPLPPRDEWGASHSYDYCGEGVQIYEIKCDDKPAEQIEIFEQKPWTPSEEDGEAAEA